MTKWVFICLLLAGCEGDPDLELTIRHQQGDRVIMCVDPPGLLSCTLETQYKLFEKKDTQSVAIRIKDDSVPLSLYFEVGEKCWRIDVDYQRTKGFDIDIPLDGMPTHTCGAACGEAVRCQ